MYQTKWGKSAGEQLYNLLNTEGKERGKNHNANTKTRVDMYCVDPVLPKTGAGNL